MQLYSTPCSIAGCDQQSEDKGYCREHARILRRASWRNLEAKKDPILKRFYNSAEWKRFRELRLSESPICQECNQQLATEVHHVEKVKDAWLKRFTKSNVLCLCSRCHFINYTRKGL